MVAKLCWVRSLKSSSVSRSGVDVEMTCEEASTFGAVGSRDARTCVLVITVEPDEVFSLSLVLSDPFAKFVWVNFGATDGSARVTELGMATDCNEDLEAEEFSMKSIDD